MRVLQFVLALLPATGASTGIAVERGPVAPNYGLVVTSATATGSIAATRGQITSVVRIDGLGGVSCSTEGADPALASRYAQGLTAQGKRASPLGGAKAAATFQLFKLDGPGEGLNDATPAAPVGGNWGTTLGQQRQLAISYAAEIWARAIQSSVPTRIGVAFDPMGCSILGGASAEDFYTFASAPSSRAFAGYWYAIANAEALAGVALNDAVAMDITMQFNSNLGTPACPGTSGPYLGFAPISRPDSLVPTATHEIAHGLGFATTTCTNPSGCGGGSQQGDYMEGFPSAFDYWAYDGLSDLYWDEMDSSGRAFSTMNDPYLVWDGPFTAANTSLHVVPGLGTTGGRIRLFAPAPFERGSSVSHFHEAAFPNLLMEPQADPEVFSELDLTPALLYDIGWDLSPRHRLSVFIVGQGGVGSGPAGIFCPNDCNELFREGEAVSVSAGAFPGHQFSGWSGACTGTSSPCVITMSQARTLTASFTATSAAAIFTSGFEG